jgi:hypothetical protein
MIIGVVRGSVTTGPARASGVGAIIGGVKEEAINPLYWLGVLLPCTG